ncbi:hypothetical protein MRS76_14985 [Rhizobiaceae bacterium n13]|uniref:Lipoprotein n=1 Tax=Ferirhizobium litorale TaxID=2927786 RepID=A0AAE3QD75_9HYPH|nr:hypothetical protein [Fererhizobium litorale]MDI7863261.1 hypothetical protein [Fererhizobium litorale]MDI7923005.1 hypothetical protein [Fererhizobium litorale]
MVPQRFFGLFAFLILPIVAACSIERPSLEEKTPRYDVRQAVVIAKGDIPPALIEGVDRRVEDAIQATVRQEPLPRVVLTIEIQEVEKQIGQKRDRNSAIVTARATAVENGMQVALITFRVFQYGSLEMADEGLAEEIAARIRSIFDLQRPSITRQQPQQLQAPAVSIDGAPLPSATTSNPGMATPPPDVSAAACVPGIGQDCPQQNP